MCFYSFLSQCFFSHCISIKTHCFLSSMLINDLFTFYYDFISQLWSIILFWLDNLLKEFKKDIFLILCWKNIYIIDIKYLIQFLLLNIWKIPFFKDEVITLFLCIIFSLITYIVSWLSFWFIFHKIFFSRVPYLLLLFSC